MNKMSIDTCFNMGSCCVSHYYIRDMKSPWTFLPAARSDSNFYPVLDLKEIKISDLLTTDYCYYCYFIFFLVPTP